MILRWLSSDHPRVILLSMQHLLLTCVDGHVNRPGQNVGGGNSIFAKEQTFRHNNNIRSVLANSYLVFVSSVLLSSA